MHQILKMNKQTRLDVSYDQLEKQICKTFFIKKYHTITHDQTLRIDVNEAAVSVMLMAQFAKHHRTVFRDSRAML